LKLLSYDNYYFRGGRRLGLYGPYRHVLGEYNVLLPCSEYCERTSMAYWALPRPNPHVLFNGVNLQQFRRDLDAAAVERAAVRPIGKVLLYVGRVCSQKGTDTLLEAFERISAGTGDVALLIAGPIGQFGTAARQDESLWVRRMQRAGATYLGAVPDSRLVGLMNLADIMVMPTRELEMFGMAAVEAQACGTPVVASDHGGLRETVPAEVGARFPPGDSGALSEAVLNLLADDAARGACSRAAIENAARFSWDQIAARLEGICASQGRPSPARMSQLSTRFRRTYVMTGRSGRGDAGLR
jgi:D-inositol-3-phosphate glycosyltransferase